MDALLFALALEVALLQMRILEGTLEFKASMKPESKLQKAQRRKLEKERKTIKDVIRKTIVELLENFDWNTLQHTTHVLYENETYPVRLRQNHEMLRKSKGTIIRDLKTKQGQWAVELRNADYKIAVIRDNIKNDLQNASARLAYVEKWLFARHEAQQLKLDSERRAPAPRFAHENRVHEELLRAFELQIEEREQTLETWKQRYSTDTSNIHKSLSEVCEKLRIATARRQELQKLFDLHEGEMRAWLTFKRERAARLAREERRSKSARLLQAWWRGIMVRRALGAFRYLKNMKKPTSKSKKK